MTRRTSKAAAEPRELADLVQDPKNARRHTPRNLEMLDASLAEVGAARSIVIDEKATILAGNATQKTALARGMKLKVIDVDRDTIVAVRRKDLTERQKTKLALFDNRTAEVAEWDADTLRALHDAGADLSALWSGDELQALTGAFDVAGVDAPVLATGAKGAFSQITFTLHTEQAALVVAALTKAKAAGGHRSKCSTNTNGNALAFICRRFTRG